MAGEKEDEITRLTKAFHDIDKDNSGYIDLSELEAAFGAAFKRSGKQVNEAEIKRACAVCSQPSILHRCFYCDQSVDCGVFV